MARPKKKSSSAVSNGVTANATANTNGEKIFGVSEITRDIKGLLESSFPSVWVEGELSRVTDHPSGHMYMALKEGNDVLDVTVWRSSRKHIKFQPETGMQVIVRGRISVYGPYGKYQLIADKMEPAGIGALQIKFEQLKKKLAAKGYFDEERKKPVPEFPSTIGVVTSPSGAAFRDIARILKRRDPGIRIILAPVLVEGAGASPQIAEAIGDFNKYKKVDVIIAGRGGGSPESLWAFNEETVADAIFKSKIPVISAVGHEIDFTIADFVSDLRASTPSAAAELAVKNRIDLISAVNSFFARLSGAVYSTVRELKAALRELAKRPVLADPARFFENDRRLVDEYFVRLANAVRRNRHETHNRINSLAKHLKLLRPSLVIKRHGDNVANLKTLLMRSWESHLLNKKRRLEKLGEKLHALSPVNILERGYSITYGTDGSIIKDQSQISVGDEIRVKLSKGELYSNVTHKRPQKAKKDGPEKL